MEQESPDNIGKATMYSEGESNADYRSPFVNRQNDTEEDPFGSVRKTN